MARRRGGPTRERAGVDEVAASDDEHTFRAQRCEPFAGFVMELCRSCLVDAQLYDWDVCFREDRRCQSLIA